MDGRIRIRRLRLCIMGAVAALFVCGASVWRASASTPLAPPRPSVNRAAPQLEISPFGYRIEQIAAVPGQPRSYDVTARAGVANAGEVARGVTAQLVGGNAGVVILDGQVGFGDVGRTAPLQPALSLDTFKLRFILPSTVSPWGLVQYFQSALNSLSWTLGCLNCGVNRPPLARAGADQTAYLGQRVMLDGSDSSDADGHSLRFKWSAVSIPQGSRVALADAAAVRPTFVVDKEGVYVFRLVVNDGLVDSAPATTTVTTRNSAPVAHAGPDRTVVVGDRIRLDGSDSTDVDGDTLTYEWTLLDRPMGSAATLSEADPSRPTAGFGVDKPGRYVAELVVYDGNQPSVPDTAVISTMNSAPVAQAGTDRSVQVGELVELNAAASSDADGDVLAYRWSLTSPAGSQATLTADHGLTTRFTVDRSGTYVVQLVVNDGSVDSAADTVVISTVNSVPMAVAGDGVTVDLGSAVTLDGSHSSDVDGDALGFNWSVVSAPPASQAQLSDPHAIRPMFVPDLSGLYVVQLLVNDGAVNSDPVTVNIVVRDSAPSSPPSPPDTRAPAMPIANRIDVAPLEAGQVRITGRPGSVESNAQIVVSNFRTGEMTTGVADGEGSFLITVAAMDDDALWISTRDSAGNHSAAVGVGVLTDIELVLLTPLPDQALAGSSVLVSGLLRAPANTGVTVNGKPAAVYFNAAGSVFETQLELSPPNAAQALSATVPVEVIARTPDGRSATVAVTVRVRTFDEYSLEASPADGPAPLTVSFNLNDNFGRGIERMTWDFDGDGAADLTSSAAEEPFQWTYTKPGTHVATAKITDASGITYEVSVPVCVYDTMQFTAGVEAVWNALIAALAHGNTVVANARLNPSAQRRFGPAFQALSNEMPRIVAGFSPPYLAEAASDMAELVVTRESEGDLRAYFVYLTRDGDGVWRVAGM